MKISARNQLKARVKTITRGSVNAEVVLEIPGDQEIVAMVTNRSLEELGLAPGSVAYAIVKASNVLVAVD